MRKENIHRIAALGISSALSRENVLVLNKKLKCHDVNLIYEIMEFMIISPDSEKQLLKKLSDLINARDYKNIHLIVSYYKNIISKLDENIFKLVLHSKDEKLYEEIKELLSANYGEMVSFIQGVFEADDIDSLNILLEVYPEDIIRIIHCGMESDYEKKLACNLINSICDSFINAINKGDGYHGTTIFEFLYENIPNFADHMLENLVDNIKVLSFAGLVTLNEIINVFYKDLM